MEKKISYAYTINFILGIDEIYLNIVFKEKINLF